MYLNIYYTTTISELSHVCGVKINDELFNLKFKLS